jgi:ligand-binding sensor domain-containing protein
MTSRIWILSLLQVALTCSGVAQSVERHSEVTFEHFNHSHGLSAPVTRITQDSIGFLWLATTDGLNRFDGKNFVVYRNIAGDSTSLINNIINDLCIDGEGNLWVATNGGVCFYQFSKDAFYAVRFDHAREEIDRHRVHAVAAASTGGIWFASKTLVHRWKDGEERQTLKLPGSENLSISYLFEDADKTLWIGTNEKLFAFRPADKSLIQTVISTPFTKERRLTTTIHPIVPYHGDSLLIGSWYGGVHKVVSHGNQIQDVFVEDGTELSPRKHVVRGLCERPDGSFWVGTYGNGLSALNPLTGRFTEHYHHDPTDPGSLSSEFVFDVFCDRSGILWIGTEAGVEK